MRKRVVRNGVVKWIGEFNTEVYKVEHNKRVEEERLRIEEEKRRKKEERNRKQISAYNLEKAKNAFLNVVIRDLKESTMEVLTTFDITDKYGKEKRTGLTVFFQLLKELDCQIPKPEKADRRANYYDAVKVRKLINDGTITYEKCAEIRKAVDKEQARKRKERKENANNS